MDEPFWVPFAELLLREEESLTDDERASLRSFRAADDVFLGLRANTPARKWADTAWEIAGHARRLGRLPIEGDPGVAPEQIAWLASQQRRSLNSFQRAYLRSLRGWVDPAGG
ncbi:hypothetical protein [Microbacterium aurantiacum]|uniref:Uncharacterized protein n=1 Tax=Microbacterium aurantiacum TaxID=162393 RepID=A0A0M8MIJ8_9MICO|nr:hypothetical protein [Microbacterium chocolatum]ANG84645.1 hypothetical protein A8L33_03925 [Microbacterium chocolatum]KOS12238.1 hypothetical protein XI38_02360 [Microbacterium chocolatum]